MYKKDLRAVTPCAWYWAALLCVGSTLAAAEDDCDSNGVGDAIDIREGRSLDCNGNRIPDDCELASGASNDCNGNLIPDDCDMLPRLALTEPMTIPLSLEINGAMVADLNQDAMPDVAVMHTASEGSPTQSLSIVLNRGGLGFEEASRIELQSGRQGILATDMNGDGAMDIVVGTEDGRIILLQNQGAGISWDPVTIDQGPWQMGSLSVGDLDNNGLNDLVAVEAWIVKIYVNHGTAFTVTAFDIPGFCAITPTVGDVDSDGDLDILVSNEGCIRNDNDVFGGMPLVALLENTRNEAIVVRFKRLDAPVFGPKLVDVDADGANDLAVNGGVFFNSENGTFGPLVSHQCGVFAQNMDMDGDGDRDFVGGQIACVNRGNRTFVRRTLLSFNIVLPADLDGDGLDDIASYVGGKTDLLIRLNRTQPPNNEDVDKDGVLDVCGVRFTRSDCTNDGAVNISDAICVVNHVLGGDDRGQCEKSADVDDNGAVAVTDAVLLLVLLFVAGPRPDGNAFDCGHDPTVDGLTCTGAHECM